MTTRAVAAALAAIEAERREKKKATEQAKLAAAKENAILAAKKEAARQAKSEAAQKIIAIRNNPEDFTRSRFGARVHLPIEDGCAFIVSDQHYWPGELSRAHRAAVRLAKKLRPYAVISNGDSLDGASISRYDPTSFVEIRSRPTVADEIAVNRQRLRDFEGLSFVKFLVWNLGNHDARYETYLTTKVPQYAGVEGFKLKDQFPEWLPAWSTNFGTELVVKHRFKGGQYAARNNAIFSGRNYVTGHDHTLWVKAFTDLNGTRFGAAAGTLADIDCQAFLHYTEDNPVDWQSGFLIAHFRSGKLTGLEPVHAMPDGRVLFRGDNIGES